MSDTIEKTGNGYEGATNSDMAAPPFKEASAQPRNGNLQRVMSDFFSSGLTYLLIGLRSVYLFFNTIALWIASIAIFFMLGIAGLSSLAMRIGSGDIQAMTFGLVLVTAFMAGSFSIAFFALLKQFSIFCQQFDQQMTALKKTIDSETRIRNAQAIQISDLRTDFRTLVGRVEQEDQQNTADYQVRENQPDIWENWSGRLIGVGGVAQGDVVESKDGDGNTCYKAQPHLGKWISRFVGERRLDRIDLFHFASPLALSGDFTPHKNLARVIATHMLVDEIAKNSGQGKLDFSNVYVHLLPSEFQITSPYFVGEKIIRQPDGQLVTQGQVIRYDAMGEVTSYVTSIIKPRVYISYDPTDIDESISRADIWMQQAVRVFTMDQLIARYGDRIKLEACNITINDDMLVQLGIAVQHGDDSRGLNGEYGVTDFGDGSFRM